MAAFTMVLNFVIAIVFGINGNKWREKNLQSRGYDYQDVVNASTPEGAIASWMKENPSN